MAKFLFLFMLLAGVAGCSTTKAQHIYGSPADPLEEICLDLSLSDEPAVASIYETHCTKWRKV